MKIETQTELISDLAKVAELPLVPAPGERKYATAGGAVVMAKDVGQFVPDNCVVPAPGEASTELPNLSDPAVMQAIEEHDEMNAYPRPSLDVAIENLANLTKHVEPFVGRLRAWDTSKLTPEVAIKFTGSVEDLAAAFVRLGDQLTAIKAMGYVAKTTPISRLRAKLQVGSKVKLAEKARIEFIEAGFTVEQMDSIQVARLGGTGAFLTTGDGTSLGLVRFSYIELV